MRKDGMNNIKKIFFSVICLFIMSVNVYAAPTSEDILTCSATANLWDGELALGLAAGNKGSSLTFDETNTSYSYSTKYIAVEPNTTYTLSYWNQSPASPGSKAFLFYLTSDLIYTASGSISIGAYGYHNYEFTTPADINYLLIRFGSSAAMSSVINGLGTNIIFQLSKGSVNLTSTDDYVSYEPCVDKPDPPLINLTNKIYLPNINYACYVVQSEGVIRAYEEMPQTNITVNYRDYYINSNYIYRDGSQTYSSYATLPTCLDSTIITDDYYYRTDLYKILIIFLIMCIFCFYLPLKIFLRLFRRFL